jgi:dUTP pyrophosphatase
MTNYEKTLEVKILNGVNFYDDKKNYNLDSGFDIFTPDEHIIKKNSYGNKIPLGISVRLTSFTNESIPIPYGCHLLPRSSLGKTPIMLANSIGIIDYEYTGEVCALVNNFSNEDFTFEKGSRYFQITSGELQPFKVIFVDDLPKTNRGSNGFGSTGV